MDSSTLFYAKIILHRENTGHSVSLDSREVFVDFGIYDAFERDITVGNDDVDGRNGLESVPVKARLAVDGSKDRAPDLVVIRR